MSATSRRAILARGSLGTILVRGAFFPLSFLVTLLLARYIGIAQLGIYSEAIAWSSVVAILGTAGLDRYSVREVSGRSARRSWSTLHGLVRRVPLFAMAFSLGAALIAFAILVLVKSDSGSNEVRTFAIAVAMAPVMALALVRQGMLQGLGKVVVSRIPEDVLRPSLFIVSMVVAFEFGRLDPVSQNAMALQAAALGAAFALGFWLLRRNLPPQVDSAEPESLPVRIVRDSIPLGLFATACAAMLQAGVIILGLTSELDQVALYATAFKIAIVVGLAEYAVNTAYQPMVASMYSSGDLSGVSRSAPKAALAVLLFSIPVAFSIIIFSEQILSLFGPPFEAGDSVLKILALSYLVSQLFGQNGSLLMMGGRGRALVRDTLVALALNVVLNLILSPAYGAEGAAVAWLGTVVVWNFLLGRSVRSELGFSPSPVVFVVRRISRRS